MSSWFTCIQYTHGVSHGVTFPRSGMGEAIGSSQSPVVVYIRHRTVWGLHSPAPARPHGCDRPLRQPTAPRNSAPELERGTTRSRRIPRRPGKVPRRPGKNAWQIQMTWQKVHFFIFLAAFVAASGSLSGCFARLKPEIVPRNSGEIPEERVRPLSLKMAAHPVDVKKLKK